MALTWEQIQANAVAFSKRWKDAAREEALAQTFEKEFLAVFGVDDALAVGEYEYRVPLDDGHNGYIDYYWPKKIAIEFKTRGKDLNKAYSQLKEYVLHLPGEDMPDLLMVCDFE
ncbi:MAG: class I SAM-dependent DNA methyltransferase, partial [Clostridia bacterium]|nr:class I SAM-dependent DNA methyltransferase [Clostridia bacterium]